MAYLDITGSEILNNRLDSIAEDCERLNSNIEDCKK